MNAAQTVHFEIRHDELHMLIAMLGMVKDLHSKTSTVSDTIRIGGLIRETYEDMGEVLFDSFSERVLAAHKIICQPPTRDDMARNDALKKQVQITLDRDEMIVLVCFDSLAAASLLSSSEMQVLIAIQQLALHMKVIGLDGAAELRAKLHAGLRAVAPDMVTFTRPEDVVNYNATLDEGEGHE